MFIPQPLLRPGVDFTTRGELKYARAAHLTNELQGRIDEWSAAETLLARVHQVDPNTFEFRAVIRREPPVDEWSLILGDAIHNLRSAFDNVVWGLATMTDAKPKKPTQVSFPFTKSLADWEKRALTLESIPPVYLQRLKDLQSWESGVTVGESILERLHQFDITDKHQSLISGALHFRQLSTAGLELNIEPADSLDDSGVTYSTQKSPVRLQHDAVLTTVQSRTHTLSPDPSFLAKVWVQFVLDWGGDERLLLDSFMTDALGRTREWLDLIYGGQTHARGLMAARQSDSASVTLGYEDESGKQHITTLPMGDFDPGNVSG